MFKKVLIANRGEIAVRIIRACREAGLQCVTVYSTADKTALHAEIADESVCIGPPSVQESYLNMNALISACQNTGAEVIAFLCPSACRKFGSGSFKNTIAVRRKRSSADGLKFHRVVEDFMAQGGDPKGDGTGGSEKTIKGEFSQNGVENSLSHTRGVVSMARSSDPDSASSQFFICYSDDDTFLDGQYAAFGKVTEGMDVVDSFLEIERSMGSDGAQSAPTTDIVMEKVKMIDDDSDGNPRVEVTMNDFLKDSKSAE